MVMISAEFGEQCYKIEPRGQFHRAVKQKVMLSNYFWKLWKADSQPNFIFFTYTCVSLICKQQNWLIQWNSAQVFCMHYPPPLPQPLQSSTISSLHRTCQFPYKLLLSRWALCYWGTRVSPGPLLQSGVFDMVWYDSILGHNLPILTWPLISGDYLHV